MTPKDPPRLRLDKLTSYMARQMAAQLDMEPVEAVRFCLFTATVLLTAEPGAIDHIKRTMAKIDQESQP